MKLGANSWSILLRVIQLVSKGGKSGTFNLLCYCHVDFISNPGAENFTSKFELYKDTENEEEFIENNKLLDRVPRNAIIGRLITDGKGKVYIQ